MEQKVAEPEPSIATRVIMWIIIIICILLIGGSAVVKYGAYLKYLMS